MFEKEISSYAFNVAKRYTGNRVPLHTLLTDSDLPENFKKFAEAEVDEIIDDEDFGKSKSGRLDMSSSEIQTLLKEIRHAIKNSFEFSREDFLDLADKASKFLFNYVIRPRWTLEKFFFKGEREISKSNFYRAERFLCDYPYYSQGITEYMESREFIDVETWRRLHAKIDEHLLATVQVNIESLTGSLSELFKFSAGYAKIPTDALVLFFRDKSAAEVVDRLGFVKEIKGIKALDYRDLDSLLQASSKAVLQTVELPRSQSESSKDYESFERRALARSKEIVEQKGSVEEKREPEGNDLQPSVPEPVAQEQTEAVPVVEAAKKAPSVRTFLDAKDEAKIIKKIFGGSRSLYHIAVHKLDESPDWTSATKIVEGIFIDNGIDPFSKYAVAFTNAISRKFDNPSKAS